MCRHLAYVGRPAAAAALLLDPPHGLVTQVDHPRCQLPGVTNRDGWGIAWQHRQGRWEHHRSTVPLSSDHEGQARLRVVEAPAVVAAVRRASPGLSLVETGNAPFVDGRWAFSLNGFVGGYTSGAREALVDALPATRVDALTGDTDSEVLFVLVRDRLDAGVPAATALVEVLQLAREAAGTEPSRLNLLLSDGRGIWATRWSNSLFCHRSPEGDVVIASEPWDDDPGWAEIPDGSVVSAAPAEVAVAPLA